jgi:hypothetical protein
VTITSMTVWGSANMERPALTWSMTTIVLVNRDTQVILQFLQDYFDFLCYEL